jgi:hypothetical protein
LERKDKQTGKGAESSINDEVQRLPVCAGFEIP